MEMIILISVLSTLGVVALVGAIVVLFRKLDDKVNTIDLEFIHKDLEEAQIDWGNEVTHTQQEVDKQFDDIYKTIDSRCDKLHDLIKVNNLEN